MEYIEDLEVRLGESLLDNEQHAIDLDIAKHTIDRLSVALRGAQAEVQRLRPRPSCPLCEDLETWRVWCPCSVKKRREESK